MVREFEAALTRLVALAGGVLSVSAATQAEVRTWLGQQGSRAAALPLEVAHNGADLAPPKNGGADGVRATIADLEGREYYLMVGSIEPRKGQLTVLDAFEHLWRGGDTARLVIAGRIGWRFGEIVRRIEGSPFAGGQLVALHDASDAEVGWLYRHARAVVLASHAEGFGLPLVEAMHEGVPVLASDIPVFRDVGGAYPEYFSLAEPGAFGKALAALRTRLAAGQRPQPQRWPTWDEAAREMIRKALALRARARAAGSDLRVPGRGTAPAAARWAR
jgi:alpha-1,2-rhamnosyltransferase